MPPGVRRGLVGSQQPGGGTHIFHESRRKGRRGPGRWVKGPLTPSQVGLRGRWSRGVRDGVGGRVQGGLHRGPLEREGAGLPQGLASSRKWASGSWRLSSRARG